MSPPKKLLATIEADCEAFDGLEFELDLAPGSETPACAWTGESLFPECLQPSSSLTLSLSCSGGNWFTDIAGCSSGDFGTLLDETCEPFELLFEYTLTGGGDCAACCPEGLTINVRITRRP
jgi:hypothetical protein